MELPIRNFQLTCLRGLVVVALLLGLCLRFVNVEHKVYWYDEVFTSLRAAGYTEAEAVEQFVDGREIEAQRLQQYQSPAPERDLTATLQSLAQEDPQHSPLYYVLAHFWMRQFGDGAADMRLLPILFSLLAFPCLYWLCQELFDSPWVSGLAVALMALSPFQLLLAQESRQYSLWVATILLSSAALLRALRLQTLLAWGLYAATLSLALYTYLFSVLVAAGHGLYVLATQGLRGKTTRAYLLASLAGSLTFLPWLLVLLGNWSQALVATEAQTKSFELSYLVKRWALNLSLIFVDFDLELGRDPALKFLIPLAVLLVGYSLFVLVRTSPKTTWLFVLTLIGTTALALALPDLILGGRRSSVARYLAPCFLGIRLAVAYCIAAHLTTWHQSPWGQWQQRLGQLMLVLVLSGGLLSCVVNSQSQTWWNKGKSYDNPQVAQHVNQGSNPLILSDARMGQLLSLSYLLDPHVRLRLQPTCHTCTLESRQLQPDLLDGLDTFSSVFLYQPSKLMRSQLTEQNYQLKPVAKLKDLWQLVP
ncbi:glycosyltransferase family 39 protein [Leptolyngbya sp. FACHB-261]|uniref:glycosyltransferase family 39 protein n=1 Tax=Leptolyngbya sp. FACHB-261 TaxID=2692806 RepID=UPI0016891FA7|nr:glycosyltransferase family 39 protein [Leptolyngbya sp. FACHB-261]MBD2103161.1 glycosyltransferase family 39 protein [Leptolyngbya sp. FACHB-261]